MGIQSLSETILLAELPPEPDLNGELKNVMEVVPERNDCDVIIDFSAVDIVTSSSLSKLLKLRKILLDCDHRMAFCCVAVTTRSIFAVTALEDVFDMYSDRLEAMTQLQAAPARYRG
jgi:anti-anti-sigma regulatory factor